MPLMSGSFGRINKANIWEQENTFEANFSLANNKTYGVVDSGGTLRNGMRLGTDNVLDIGDAAVVATRIQANDLHIDATKKFFLDNGGDTFFHEVSANKAELVVGGNVQIEFPTGALADFKNSSLIANVVSPTSPNRTISVKIGGTTFFIHAKTTND